MRARSALSILAAGALWLLSTANASAVTLTVIDNGMTSLESNYGCQTGATDCRVQWEVRLDAPVDVTGSIDINAAVTVAYIDFSIDGAVFGPIFAGGPTVTFDNVHYTGSVPIMQFGGTIAQLAPGSGTITGLANGTPFTVYPSVVNLTCSSLTGPGQCGVQFGRNGFTNVAGHDFVNTFNVLVTPVPEPLAGLLVVAGLAGLALRTRRA